MFYWNPASVDLSGTFWCIKGLFGLFFSLSSFDIFLFRLEPRFLSINLRAAIHQQKAALVGKADTTRVSIAPLCIKRKNSPSALFSLKRALLRAQTFSTCYQPQRCCCPCTTLRSLKGTFKNTNTKKSSSGSGSWHSFSEFRLAAAANHLLTPIAYLLKIAHQWAKVVGD